MSLARWLAGKVMWAGNGVHSRADIFVALFPHGIDALGSTAFAPVKSDINGNIKVQHADVLWALAAALVLK
jgi:hypothetical protein